MNNPTTDVLYVISLRLGLPEVTAVATDTNEKAEHYVRMTNVTSARQLDPVTTLTREQLAAFRDELNRILS